MSSKVTQTLTGNVTMAAQTSGNVIEFSGTLVVPPVVTIPILTAVGSTLTLVNLSASAILIKDLAGRNLNLEIPKRCSLGVASDGTAWYAYGAPCPLQGCAPKVLPQLRGANLAGGTLTWQTLPPNSGTNYLFGSTQDVDYLQAKGCNFVRLTFSWEAIQSTLNGTLGTGGAAYSTYLSQFQALVTYITGKGMYCMIEPHGAESSDFAAWKGNAVGTTAVPNTAFANLWMQLAQMYGSNPFVIFGLSNEPCSSSMGGPTGGGGVAAWFTSCNAAIAAIRTEGAGNLIMVPGQQFTAASQWTSNWYDTGSPQISNMTGVAAIVDPLQNWCISTHLYVDSNGSGAGTDITGATAATSALSAMVTAARTAGYKIHLSEFGVQASTTPLAQEVVADLVQFLDSNMDVMLGMSWWVHGPSSWWSGANFTLASTQGSGTDVYSVDSPQMALAQQFWSANTSAEIAALQPQAGVTGGRPSAPLAGQMFFDTTKGFPVWWTGSAWVNSVGVAS